MLALSSILPEEGVVRDTVFEGFDITQYLRPSVDQVDEFLENGIYLFDGEFGGILMDPNAVKLISAVRVNREIVSYVMLCDNFEDYGQTLSELGDSYGLIGVYTREKHRHNGYARVAMKHMATYLSTMISKDHLGVLWSQDHIRDSFAKVFGEIAPQVIIQEFRYLCDMKFSHPEYEIAA